MKNSLAEIISFQNWKIPWLKDVNEMKLQIPKKKEKEYVSIFTNFTST